MFRIATIALLAIASISQAQWVTTPSCPNGLCPRIQQALPAAFPAQPLIQIGQPIQGYWTTPGVQPWTAPLPLTVPAPMPGPGPTPSPSPNPGPAPAPTPIPSPTPVAECKPLLFPNFQPFGGRFRPTCRCGK